MGISMSRIGNSQSAHQCFEYLEHLTSKIEYTEGIGMELWYSDYLYLHSSNPAVELRSKFLGQMISHKNAFMNLLIKDRKWTLKAFSFRTFGQLFLDNSEQYHRVLQAVVTLYKSDSIFQTLVKEDVRSAGRSNSEEDMMFILEEISMFYLAQKGVFTTNNRLVSDAEKTWSLITYPGAPLLSEIYLFQKNPLQLSQPKNLYQDCYYDLEGQVLYDYNKVYLEI